MWLCVCVCVCVCVCALKWKPQGWRWGEEGRRGGLLCNGGELPWKRGEEEEEEEEEERERRECGCEEEGKK